MTRRTTTAEHRQQAKFRRSAFWSGRIGAEEQPDLRMARAFDLLRTRLRQYEKRALRFDAAARTQAEKDDAEWLVTTVYEVFGHACQEIAVVLEVQAAEIEERTDSMARTLAARRKHVKAAARNQRRVARTDRATHSAMHDPAPKTGINVQPSRAREVTTNGPDGAP